MQFDWNSLLVFYLLTFLLTFWALSPHIVELQDSRRLSSLNTIYDHFFSSEDITCLVKRVFHYHEHYEDSSSSDIWHCAIMEEMNGEPYVEMYNLNKLPEKFVEENMGILHEGKSFIKIKGGRYGKLWNLGEIFIPTSADISIVDVDVDVDELATSKTYSSVLELTTVSNKPYL